MIRLILVILLISNTAQATEYCTTTIVGDQMVTNCVDLDTGNATDKLCLGSHCNTFDGETGEVEDSFELFN